MTTIADMMVRLGMDVSSFKAGADKAKGSLGELEKSMKTLDSTGKGMSKVGTALSVGVTAPLMAATTALASFTVEAASMVKVRDAFEGIAEAAGTSGDAVLAAMKKGSQGMTANIDLMKSYNLANQLVSEDFANKLPEAMGYLGKVSAATGESMDFMMNSLIRGVGRLSPLILDNLGIQVDMNASYEEYARVLGKSTDELTKAEKQTAIMNATMAALKANTASMPDDFGNVAQSLKASFQNAKDSIGETLIPVLNEVTGSLTKTIEKIVEMTTEGGNLYPAIQNVGKAFTSIVDGIGKFVDKLSTVDPVMLEVISDLVLFLAGLGPVLVIVGKLTSGIASVIPALSKMGIGLLGVSVPAIAAAAAVAGVVVAIGALVGAAVYFNSKSKEMANSILLVRDNAVKSNQSFEEYTETLRVNGQVSDGLFKNIMGVEARWKAARSSLEEFNKSGIISNETMTKMNGKIYAGTMHLDEFEKAMYDAAVANNQLATDSETANRAMTTFNELKINAVRLANENVAAIEAETEAQIKYEAEIAQAIVDIQSLGTNFGSLISYAQAYDDIQEKLNEKIGDMLKYDINGDGFVDMADAALDASGEIGGLIGQLDELANQATLSMLQATIAVGGVSKTEMALYLDLAVAMGQTSRDGANAAMENYGSAIDFMNALTIDPKTGEVSVADEQFILDILALDGMTLQEKTALITTHIEGLEEAENDFKHLARNRTATITINQIPGTMVAQERAIGGPVERSHFYTVGEKGPELFIPNVSGTIIPNQKIENIPYGAQVPKKGGGGYDEEQDTVSIDFLMEQILTALRALPDNISRSVRDGVLLV